MEIYGVDGVLYADNRNDLRIRMSKGYDGYNEDFFNLVERQEPIDDPFALFAAVIKNEFTLKPFDLSSLKNNMIVIEILEAARKSSKTKIPI